MRIMDIVPVLYNSYLFPKGSYIHGRMLKGKSMPMGQPGNYWFTNMRRTLQLFTFQAWKELNGMCQFAGLELPFTTDDEGYFKITVDNKISTRLASLENRWEPLQYSFEGKSLEAKGKILITNPVQSPIGLITDVDDTIVKTDVRNKKRTIWHAVVGNAYRKKVFDGAADYLRSFTDLKAPCFYVTRSPFELYPRMCKVFDINKFPSGPLLMRRVKRKDSYHQHDFEAGQKIRFIRQIMRDSNPMKWVLIGDSSENDTSIYLTVAKEFPKQVAAIFIRLVDKKSCEQAFAQRKRFHSPAHFQFFGNYLDLPKPAEIIAGRFT